MADDHGEPPFDPQHLFWQHVQYAGWDACAVYEGPGSRGQYGHVRVTWDDGRRLYAPRLAWELLDLGPIDGILCHSCDRPGCVNLWSERNGAGWHGHLLDADDATNVAHRETRNRRSPRLARGEYASASKLTARDVAALFRAREQGLSAKVLAPVFQVSVATIFNAWSGKHHGVHKPWG
jgi:hypothetical protein